jgi:hypothetical protein
VGFTHGDNYTYPTVTADFNNDGRGDVFAVRFEGMADWAVGTVYLGRADGTFDAGQTFPVGSNPGWVAAGDIDGDGATDLAVYNYYSDSDQPVSVYRNDGIWPSTPQLRIGDVTVVEGNAGTLAATFTVTLNNGLVQPITVAYATGNGTATAGSDYQAASGTLTFAPGETTKTITVPIIGDQLPEPNETYVVNLSGPTNATIADGQGVGTILDDEPRVRITDVTKAEGKKNQTTLFTFTVTLSAAYDQPVTVSFHTVDGTATTADGDYAARTGTLTFAPGETTKTITVEVRGDSKREATETFYLDLFGTSGNALLLDGRGVGTILNDD